MPVDVDEQLRRVGDHLDRLTPEVRWIEVVDRRSETVLPPTIGALDTLAAVEPRAPRRSPARARFFAAAAAIVLAGGAAGLSILGSRGDGDGGPLLATATNVAWYATVAAAEPDEEAAYQACMAAAGYDSVAIGAPPIGVIPAGSVWANVDYERAFRHCIVAAGLGEVAGDTPEEVASKNATAIGLTTCMRSRGWDMPEPTRHPVAGYLVPGGPTIPPDPTAAAKQFADLRACGEPYGVDVLVDEP